ncbi:MAG: hypothetical protein IPH45_03510 [Bacteroidales bacterium]|nr:hypothetical protein [Bacteroidales bacterium]
MKNNLLILLIALFVSGLSYAQPLTGIKSIPGDYSTVEAAIADLNAQNVGAGGVTFNIAANYVETFTSPSAGSITTLTGSATQPIVFKKSGSGLNPVITAAVGIGTMDAVFTISGCDYVTFDGINVVENPLNTNATSQMEWGFAILKNSESNGSQNITISNCNISLNIAYTATVGIYANNHTVANTTVLPVNSISGTNSNLKIYSNKIDNCYSGISVTGYNDIVAPYTYLDQNNEIGKDGANTITNVAGQTATPAVAGYGIYGKAQNNLIVANNIITSTMGGNGSPSGIYLTSGNNGSYELYGNTVNFQFNGTGTVALNAIFSDMGASASSGTTNIYNNTVSGCTYPTLTTGTVYFMSLTNLGTNVNVYGNNVTNNSTGSASVVATGTIRYLQCQVASTVITTGSFIVHDNVISGNTRTQSIVGGGGTNFLYVGGKASSLNMFNNQVINNVIGSNGTANLIYSGTDAGSQNVYDNLIENISKAEGQTYGITAYNVTSGSGPCHYYRNIIRNIEGLGAFVYIYGFNIVGSHTYNIYNNMAGDFRAPATSGTTTSNDRLFGCYSSSSVTLLNLFNNTIYLNNTSTGANFGSAALSITGSATKSDIRNNILVNTSTPSGTGRTVVVRFPNTSTSQATSNYNNLYAGTPSANKLIFYNGTTGYQTLNDYKTLVYPRELQSVTEMPPFISIASGSTDLHLQNEVATQCEAGGISVSSPVVINTDYDTDPRFPAGYPERWFTQCTDIGADEMEAPNDITGPAITYNTIVSNKLNHKPYSHSHYRLMVQEFQPPVQDFRFYTGRLIPVHGYLLWQIG